ncbi:hypothetical protein [Paraburkholderia sediminicola]|uniref:hypothetical protein n=1 Tax=Paraburkholderia sediminicola TaxID=458836 RepID=UPI0038BB3DF5
MNNVKHCQSARAIARRPLPAKDLGAIAVADAGLETAVLQSSFRFRIPFEQVQRDTAQDREVLCGII